MTAPLKLSIEIVTPFRQNCAIIWDDTTKRGTIVDPGGEPERLFQTIARLGIVIDQILLTHGHIDHAGGVTRLRDDLAAAGLPTPQIVGPQIADQFLLESLPTVGAQYGMLDALPVTPDRWLEEGDTVEIAGHRFAVRHCPGHTPGHVVFISEELGFAIVGDVLFRGSVGRTDFPYCDTEALLAAIRTKLLTLDDRTVFICGHGARSAIGEERRSNPFVGEGA